MSCVSLRKIRVDVTKDDDAFLEKVYNASNNELVRTNTLVKGAIIQVDATPFRVWYEAHVRVLIKPVRFSLIAHTLILQYALPVTKKGAKAAQAEEKKDGEEKKLSNHAQRNLAERKKGMHRFFFTCLVTGVYLTNCRVLRCQD